MTEEEKTKIRQKVKDTISSIRTTDPKLKGQITQYLSNRPTGNWVKLPTGDYVKSPKRSFLSSDPDFSDTYHDIVDQAKKGNKSAQVFLNLLKTKRSNEWVADLYDIKLPERKEESYSYDPKIFQLSENDSAETGILLFQLKRIAKMLQNKKSSWQFVAKSPRVLINRLRDEVDNTEDSYKHGTDYEISRVSPQLKTYKREPHTDKLLQVSGPGTEEYLDSYNIFDQFPDRFWSDILDIIDDDPNYKTRQDALNDLPRIVSLIKQEVNTIDDEKEYHPFFPINKRETVYKPAARKEFIEQVMDIDADPESHPPIEDLDNEDIEYMLERKGFDDLDEYEKDRYMNEFTEDLDEDAKEGLSDKEILYKRLGKEWSDTNLKNINDALIDHRRF